MEPVNIFAGPVPQARAARQAIVDRILADLQRTYGDQIIAVGLYGSMARASDLPYSDVEIYCVLMGEEIDLVHEWVYGLFLANEKVNVWPLKKSTLWVV